MITRFPLLSAFGLAIAFGGIAEAGLIHPPAGDEVVLSLGVPVVDDAGGTASFALTYHFGDDLLGLPISLLGINVEASTLNGSAIPPDSPLFNAFSFIPEPGSAITDWSALETFGSGIAAGLEEWTPDAGDALPLATSSLTLGKLVFDFGVAGIPSDSPLTVDLSGGTLGTVLGIDFTDSSQPPGTRTEFVTPRVEPASRTVGDSGGPVINPIPEPTSLAIFLAAAGMLGMMGLVGAARRPGPAPAEAR